ncbi:MAG: hypothetical protein ACREGF_04720, partial [Candidatus Saccharimonadales bacterium]
MDDYSEKPVDKRLRVLAGLVIFAVIVLALVAIFGHKSPPTITHNQKTNPALHTVSQKYAVPANFAQAVAYGSDSLLVSSGQSFVSYNYVSAQTKSLGPNAGSSDLANIDSINVSADKQYVLFHQQIANPGGILYSLLTQKGINTSSPYGYWWVYDVKNQSFEPLPQGVLLAKIDGQTVDSLSYANGGESITSYQVADLQKISTTSVPGSSNFFPVKGGFLLQSPDNKVLLNQGGAVNQTLFTSAIVVGVLPNQSLGVGTVTTKGVRQLEELNINQSSASLINKDIQNLPVWLGSGEVIYITAANTNQAPAFYEYNLNTHKNEALNFSQALGNTSAA